MRAVGERVLRRGQRPQREMRSGVVVVVKMVVMVVEPVVINGYTHADAGVVGPRGGDVDVGIDAGCVAQVQLLGEHRIAGDQRGDSRAADASKRSIVLRL